MMGVVFLVWEIDCWIYKGFESYGSARCLALKEK